MQLQAIYSLFYAYTSAVAIVRDVNKLPAVARGLVVAVLGFAIGVLRTILTMLVMNLAIDTVGVLIKNSFIGRAITMLQQSRLFRAAEETISNCAAKFRLCKLLPKLLPKLPCVAKAVAVQGAADAALGIETSTLDYAAAAVGGLAACRDRGAGKGGKADKADEGGTCVPNSFDGATGVLLADGTTKRIDEVVVGDVVWAADPKTDEAGPREVTALIFGEGRKELVDVTIVTDQGEDNIIATANHPFWVASTGKWLAAAALVVGMALATADGGTAEITATDAYTEPHLVYNLTVEDLHTYFVVVGDESVLVHNCPPDDPVSPMPPRGNLVRKSDGYFKQNGIDPHSLKNEYLPPSETSKWDIARDTRTGDLWLVKKHGDVEPIKTYENIP